MGLNFLSNIASAISPISDIMKAMSLQKTVASRNVPTGSEKQSLALYKAILDPSNPMVSRMAQQEQELGMANLLSTIRAMQTADRRNVAMGRVPTFFNPERADEAQSFMLSRSMAPMAMAARENAINRIIQSAGGMKGFIPYQQSRADRSLGQKMQNIEERYQYPKQIMDYFNQPSYSTTDLFQMLGKPQPYGPVQPINWGAK